jgi:hypothetical protein
MFLLLLVPRSLTWMVYCEEEWGFFFLFDGLFTTHTHTEKENVNKTYKIFQLMTRFLYNSYFFNV